MIQDPKDVRYSRRMEIIDFGIGNYEEILNLQMQLFGNLVNEKKNKKKNTKEYILIGEHNPVITLGRRAKETNVLYSEDYFKKRGIGIYHVSRGGDVTYHCPGQLIVYPILNLEAHKMGVKDYVMMLEESVIRLLDTYGMKGERIEGATGVWLGKNTENERKISAIGIKCSHYCSMHGLSLNINPDLSGFSLINPCGFTDRGVTSIQMEKDREINMEEIKKRFLHIFLGLIFPFEEVFNFSEKL